MKSRLKVFASVLLCLSLVSAAAPTHKLASVKKAPAGLSKEMTAKLNPAGHKIIGPKGPVCEIWFLKNVDVKPGFKPSLSVKYPFTPGQLLGALRVAKKVKFTDFRGQELKAGTYTLRYGQQPEDGNHVGTSELADFMLSIPAKNDVDLKPITDFDELSEKSAKSAGSTHPAIFSILPSAKPPKTASLSHDEDHDFWILNLSVSGKAKGKGVKVPLRFIAVGRSPE